MIECVNKSNNFCENSNTIFVGGVEDNLKPINYKFECNQRKKCHNLWNQRWKRCVTKLMSYTWQFVNENCSQQITSNCTLSKHLWNKHARIWVWMC